MRHITECMSSPSFPVGYGIENANSFHAFREACVEGVGIKPGCQIMLLRLHNTIAIFVVLLEGCEDVPSEYHSCFHNLHHHTRTSCAELDIHKLNKDLYRGRNATKTDRLPRV
jgi:hypothetical protein